jgi:YD repeat-containing protein
LTERDDAENRLETAGAPGRGTVVFKYDYERGTRLLREIERADGVVATATERDPLRDQLLTLRTTSGAESYNQFFQYDGQERLQSRWDDLGAASEVNPNEQYTYRYATASVPAGVYLSTLMDAESASLRERVELATAAGESIGTVARVPEGWVFGRLSKRSRSRGEEQGSLLAAVSAGTDPTALDYASLFVGNPIDFTSTSDLAGVREQRTTYHAGVERRTTSDQAINGGVLASTSTENGTHFTSTRADAAKRVLSFDDEAGVRYTYVYDALGRVRQVLLPDGRKHTATYDGHGRPSQIVREAIATIDVGYHPVSGLRESKRFSSPSGDLHRTVSWAYDAIGRVTEERHLDSTGASKVYTNYWDGATPLEPLAKTSPGLLTAVTGDGYS